MDTLTGMYNRMGYQQLGEESFRISGLNKRKLLILFVDLDRLKYINDTFGHEYGDMAICAAARALMQCSSRDAVPARTGGDEFVLIQSYQSDEGFQRTGAAHPQNTGGGGKSPEASVPVVHEYRNCRDGSGIRTVFCRLC